MPNLKSTRVIAKVRAAITTASILAALPFYNIVAPTVGLPGITPDEATGAIEHVESVYAMVATAAVALSAWWRRPDPDDKPVPA